MKKSALAVLQSWQTAFSNPVSISYRTLLLVILLAGLLLRLGAIYFAQGYHHFMVNDEVKALEYVLAFLAGEEQTWYLAQPAFNSGSLPGPLWTLLGVALFKLGGNSAEGALYWMAALNSITVYFIYLLASRFFTSNLALLTTAVYALAPWTIYYSYGLYNPVPLDLIGVLLFLALWHVVSNAHSKQVFWVMLLCAAIPQFHMIGVFVIPAILLLLILTPAQLNMRWLLAGIIAGVMLYLPYILGDMQHDWRNLKAIISGGEDRAYSASALKVITAPATVLSSVPAGWTGDSVESIKQFGNNWFGHYVVLVTLGGWTLIHGFVYLFHFLRRYTRLFISLRYRPAAMLKENPTIAFVGILVIVPLLLFVLTGHNFSTRYAIILFPLLFLLPGLFLQTLRRPVLMNYWAISLVFIAVFNLYLLGSYYAHQNQRLASDEQFMPSFRKLDRIYQAVKNDAVGAGQIEIVLSGEVNELPHFEHKLIYTIKHYITAFERYQHNVVQLPTLNRYQVTLPGAQVKGTPVFSDNSIVVARISS